MKQGKAIHEKKRNYKTNGHKVKVRERERERGEIKGREDTKGREIESAKDEVLNNRRRKCHEGKLELHIKWTPS